MKSGERGVDTIPLAGFADRSYSVLALMLILSGSAQHL
jgi:hypothetical protein